MINLFLSSQQHGGGISIAALNSRDAWDFFVRLNEAPRNSPLWIRDPAFSSLYLPSTVRADPEDKLPVARLDLTALASAFRRRGCSSSERMILPRQKYVDGQDIACHRDARIVDRSSKDAQSSRMLSRKWTGCCNGRGHSWTVHAHAIYRYALSLIDRTVARVTIAGRRWPDASHVALV